MHALHFRKHQQSGTRQTLSGHGSRESANAEVLVELASQNQSSQSVMANNTNIKVATR
jgi:hypothetical protein